MSDLAIQVAKGAAFGIDLEAELLTAPNIFSPLPALPIGLNYECTASVLTGNGNNIQLAIPGQTPRPNLPTILTMTSTGPTPFSFDIWGMPQAPNDVVDHVAVQVRVLKSGQLIETFTTEIEVQVMATAAPAKSGIKSIRPKKRGA